MKILISFLSGLALAMLFFGWYVQPYLKEPVVINLPMPFVIDHYSGYPYPPIPTDLPMGAEAPPAPLPIFLNDQLMTDGRMY